MKRTYGDYEIPGFYVEPQTGRYFQVPINGSPLPSLFNGARVEPASADFNIRRRRVIYEPKRPRFNSILNCVSGNQMGSVSTLSYQQEVSALRMENFRLANQYVYPFGNNGLDIRLLKGGTKYLYGHWSSNSNSTYIYAIDNFTNVEAPACVSHHYQAAYISPQIVVADVCEAYSHRLSILYVGNDFNSGLGTSRLAWRRERSHDVSEGSRHFYINSAVWCCSSNRFTGLFALGIENGIYLHNYDSHLHTKAFRGQVLGIHYKKSGNIIYASLNHGKLITVDLRVRNPVCKTKLNDYALTELSLLEDENYMICAGLGNFLAQVDLRMQRKTVTYLGELRNTLKNPISFNETHNILCSSGSDSVARLWSLRGGRPLKMLPPPFPGHESRAWLLNNASPKMTLYVASKQMIYIHEC